MCKQIEGSKSFMHKLLHNSNIAFGTSRQKFGCKNFNEPAHSSKTNHFNNTFLFK